MEEALPDLKGDELLQDLKQLQPNMQGTVFKRNDFVAQSKKDLCDENALKSPDFIIVQEKVKKLLRKYSTE